MVADTARRDSAAPAANGAVRIRFWGVRGSIPAPGPSTARYGGNTSCVTIEAPGCELIVLDAGTGIRALGAELMRAGTLPLTAHLFLSHTHWDHIQGFPFFAPAFMPGNRLVIHGARGTDEDLAEALEGQMLYRYFPVRLTDLGADILFSDLRAGTHALAGARVTVARTRHPGGACAYRFELGGRTIVYATDTEPEGQYPDLLLDPELLALARGADVLIHDAQYTDEEFQSKIGWGHSPVSYVVRLAAAAGVRRLVLFHHDPSRDDDALDAIVVHARATAAAHALSDTVRVEAAAEGTEIALPLRASPGGTAAASGAAPDDAVPATTAPELRRGDIAFGAGHSTGARVSGGGGSVSNEAANGIRPAPELSIKERVHLLRRAPLFRLLRDDELVPLAEACTVVTFEAGEMLVRQGEPGEHLFIIIKGIVEVSIRPPGEGLVIDVPVATLGVGEALGELALVDGRPRSGTAVAQRRTVCLRLSRRAFVGAARRHWSVAHGLLAVLASRLRQADERLGDLARDRLTGVYSGRALLDLYERELARARRLAQGKGDSQGSVRPSLAILVCDIDRLDAINQTHGVPAGDEVLRATARSLAAVVRGVDAVGRVGSDEFAVLLPETDVQGARLVAERVQRLLQHQPLAPAPFTVRFGTAVVDQRSPVSFDELLGVAARAARSSTATAV